MTDTATLPDQLETAPPMQPVNVTDKTVAVSITFTSIGNSRKVSTSQVEVDTDKSLIRVSKTLLDSGELAAIGKLDAETRAAIVAIALPSFFRSGVYLVPIPAIEMIEGILEDAKGKRAALIEAFLNVYKERKAQAEVRLKTLFNPADYPTIGQVRAAFTFDWSWVSFSTPGKLKEISADFFKQEQEKAASKWQQATDEITLLLRQQLKDLVDHMLDRLEPGNDGKPRKFHGTTVTKIKTFLDSFSIRNVTDDAQLAMIVKSAAQLLEGVNVDDIRENEAVRSNTQKGFQLVKDCLDTLVVEAGSRKIVLDEEETV
jgi:hypothetical protein